MIQTLDSQIAANGEAAGLAKSVTSGGELDIIEGKVKEGSAVVDVPIQYNFDDCCFVFGLILSIIFMIVLMLLAVLFGFIFIIFLVLLS
jgi:hypothetical protein